MNNQDEMNVLSGLERELAGAEVSATTADNRVRNLKEQIKLKKIDALKEMIKLDQFEWELSFHPNSYFDKQKLRAQDFNLTTPHGYKNNETLAKFVQGVSAGPTLYELVKFTDTISLQIDYNHSQIYICGESKGKPDRSLEYARKIIKEYNLRVNITDTLQWLEETTKLVKRFDLSQPQFECQCGKSECDECLDSGY